MVHLALRPQTISFDAKWPKLHGIVDAIIRQDSPSGVSRTDWEDAFADVYQLCVAVPEPLGDQLYQHTKDAVQAHAQSLSQEVAGAGEGRELLKAYVGAWTRFSRGAEQLDKLFSYLNKQHIKRQVYSDADLTYGGLTMDQIRNSMLEIGELCLDIWRREVMEGLGAGLVAAALKAVAEERAGLIEPERSLIREALLSFVTVQQCNNRGALDLYEEVAERPYIQATRVYYESEAQQLLQSLDVSEYMKEVMVRIEAEMDRSRAYLHSSSEEKVRGVCQDVLVAKHKERLDEVTQSLVEQQKRHDLANMYQLLRPVPSGVGILVGAFEAHARALGKEAVAQAIAAQNIPLAFVEKVLAVHSTLRSWVSDVFKEDGDFVTAMDNALESAVNFKDSPRAVPKASEWLAKYCDVTLRRTGKGMGDGELENALSSAITIFRYVADKDIFQKFYSRMLAQRLIHGLSVSMDGEEGMINKLKNACGYEFTSKLQRMFTDVGLSKELSEKLANESGSSTGPQLAVHVLQAGAWPLNQPTTSKDKEKEASTTSASTSSSSIVGVPLDLEPEIRRFEAFYAKNYSGRKLNFLYGLATAEVRLGYLDKSYVVTTSLAQLQALRAFQDADERSISEIAEASQTNGDALTKLIRSLVESGLVLQASEDRLRLNFAFTRKGHKFKISTASIHKQTEKMETETVCGTVAADRKHYLECTIVRIMKTRKILRHNPLVQEVIHQSKSRFTPDVGTIKRIIETLIDKQYLQRTDTANDEYSYLA